MDSYYLYIINYKQLKKKGKILHTQFHSSNYYASTLLRVVGNVNVVLMFMHGIAHGTHLLPSLVI